MNSLRHSGSNHKFAMNRQATSCSVARKEGCMRCDVPSRAPPCLPLSRSQICLFSFFRFGINSNSAGPALRESSKQKNMYTVLHQSLGPRGLWLGDCRWSLPPEETEVTTPKLTDQKTSGPRVICIAHHNSELHTYL